MLLISKVETFYGNIQALRGVNVKVNSGEIVSLIGSNGAGKSTLLMTISGVNKAATGEIKFDDKTLHRSKLIRYFYEKDYSLKKTQKELENIYKKIKRNKNYFYSAKDIAVLESLEYDGILIPKEINHKDLSGSYNVPDNLNDLAEKGEKGYLALKIVEIIGEDEVNNLDPETLYFITNLLNKLELKEFRN